MLRILHIVPYYQEAWAYGGIPRVVTALATEQASRGHHVTVCTTDAHLQQKRLRRPPDNAWWRAWKEVSNGVTVRVFPNVSNRLAYHDQLFLPIGMHRYLRQHAGEFDIAHIHACRNIPGVLAARALRRVQVPYVVAPNGTAPLIESRHVAKSMFDRTLGRDFLEGAAHVIAVTEAERRHLLKMGVPETRITVVPNPIILSEFNPPIQRGAFRLRAMLDSARVVTYLGKITPRKRLDVLAQAFAVLRAPNARLIVAGNDMGYRSTLQRVIAAAGIRDRTTLTGLLRGRSRLEALADADVVVYATKDEIFGLVPIEALMCGTPVIVADDSGCAEVIRHLGGGLIVREGDPEHLGQAIATILSDPVRWREAAARARERIPAFCGAASVCTRIETLYRQILHR